MVTLTQKDIIFIVRWIFTSGNLYSVSWIGVFWVHILCTKLDPKLLRSNSWLCKKKKKNPKNQDIMPLLTCAKSCEMIRFCPPAVIFPPRYSLIALKSDVSCLYMSAQTVCSVYSLSEHALLLTSLCRTVAFEWGIVFALLSCCAALPFADRLALLCMRRSRCWTSLWMQGSVGIDMHLITGSTGTCLHVLYFPPWCLVSILK